MGKTKIKLRIREAVVPGAQLVGFEKLSEYFNLSLPSPDRVIAGFTIACSEALDGLGYMTELVDADGQAHRIASLGCRSREELKLKAIVMGCAAEAGEDE